MGTVTDLVAAGNEVVDPDGEVLGLLETRSTTPMDDLEVQDLVPALDVRRVVLVHNRTALQLYSWGRRWQYRFCAHTPPQPLCSSMD